MAKQKFILRKKLITTIHKNKYIGKTMIEVLFNLFDRVTVDNSSLIQCGKFVKNV